MQTLQKVTYSVLDKYPLDIPVCTEELQAVRDDMSRRHGPIMDTGAITTCIVPGELTIAHDPLGEFAHLSMGQGVWCNISSKIDTETEDLYEGLSRCTNDFLLPVVFRFRGDRLIDAYVMLFDAASNRPHSA